MADGKEDKEKGVSVWDFFLEQKLNAFCATFRPVQSEDVADEVMNDARLRSFFQAWPRPCGDTLLPYLEKLENRGYTMTVTRYSDEPVLLVRRAHSDTIPVWGMDMEEDDECSE